MQQTYTTADIIKALQKIMPTTDTTRIPDSDLAVLATIAGYKKIDTDTFVKLDHKQ